MATTSSTETSAELTAASKEIEAILERWAQEDKARSAGKPASKE